MVAIQIILLCTSYPVAKLLLSQRNMTLEFWPPELYILWSQLHQTPHFTPASLNLIAQERQLPIHLFVKQLPSSLSMPGLIWTPDRAVMCIVRKKNCVQYEIYIIKNWLKSESMYLKSLETNVFL